jgi:glycosyltransferase involved in cell wall biosynthesis
MESLELDDWVIIAAYNEENNILSTIRDVLKHAQNIIVVDDGSKDNTYKIAHDLVPFVLKHVFNMGKGAALKTGCDFALKKGAKNMFVIDGDGQHDPVKLPLFKEELKNNQIVFGYRSFSKDMPLILRCGNLFINKITYLLYGLNLRDTQCGYRAFTSETYHKIKWSAQDYSMESEMIKNAGKHRLSYAQIPIETIYSDKYKGTTVVDGIKIVARLLMWRITG